MLTNYKMPILAGACAVRVVLERAVRRTFVPARRKVSLFFTPFIALIIPCSPYLFVHFEKLHTSNTRYCSHLCSSYNGRDCNSPLQVSSYPIGTQQRFFC